MGHKRVDYDTTQHAGYAKGRRLLPVSRRTWMRAFRELSGGRRVTAAVDVGSGTGRFTPVLADEFAAPVTGVEPSERMREVALVESAHPLVTYVPGHAADLPIADGAADLALMFLVWHHVPDKPAAARELARVLAPGTRLLIATTFADRPKDLLTYRYFPRAREIDLEVFPTLGDTAALFDGAGFDRAALTEVHHRSADSLAEYTRRQRMRALSVYEHLSDREYRDGMAAMEADAAAETEPRPVESGCDLLALTRR
ncbi:class I SAM-dependent methyltransferase [Glycomyces harbinensis]|uniref:Ubiquinone/menaquinone biosynthesis C-methylase UbiE n=1 Tax=Glycomyces harbinensis TaxID=58114 RepID=A0A1G6RKN9_9ACTN|nr:class I SAM-dependent methyltransferase [Glycomyces harbinensis]SDD05230.1 Ubiquinone/menaquinone biosynthesis C-methylase UbiE [Glycomyces harbinensis]